VDRGGQLLGGALLSIAAICVAGTLHLRALNASPAPAEPGQAVAHAGKRAVSVALYGATWCRYCRMAKAWLREHDVPFVEHDIDAEPSAREALRRLNPRGSVPTIDVEGEVLIGFSDVALQQAIDRAEARHGKP
jgi:glutaredoxin